MVSATAAGRAMADHLAAAWPRECTRYEGTVTEQVQAAWAAGGALVCFLATGATVRLVAPLLAGKHIDPGVVCVDEAGRYAVALLGGHSGAANALATRVAEVLGAEPVITTATDATGRTAFDTFGADIGFRLPSRAGLARVTAAMLDGAPVTLHSDATWPVPALPTAATATAATTWTVSGDPAAWPLPAAPVAPAASGAVQVVVSDRSGVEGDLVYRPPSLVVGVGASRGVPAGEVAGLIEEALAGAGLAAESVRALATIDAKADEPGIRAVAQRHGWPVLTYPAEELAGEQVPNPSAVVQAAVGTPSVAEAAALRAARAAGRAAELVVPKRSSAGLAAPAMATVAVTRLVPRGRLTLVGLGPGADDLRAPRAVAALRRAALLVGLDQYVDQVRHLLRPGTRVLSSGLGAEQERVRTAVELATEGNAVALIGSGDAGIYALASPALQIAGSDVDVVVVPGITAATAAAATLGAPLGHDHACVSLSDLHTPWSVIADRLRACAAADLVVCLYNPRSARRTAQFDEALATLRAHRGPQTPVGVVRDATRPGEQVTVTTLAGLDSSIVDMRSIVLVGSSRTRVVAGRMVTPREYRWLQ